MSTGPSGFKKLVKISARVLYSGPCPPRDSTGPTRRKWEKVDTSGLAIVVLDALTRKEWVKEDLLAEELKIAPKLLRKTLRYLEEEHVLRREHRKEGKRAQNKDVVVLATKGARMEEQPIKARLHSYCAIDYPGFMDMLMLRLFLMKQKLKSELEEENPVMNYICPTCTSTFSSLDFALLLDRDTGLMRCDQCGTEVLEQFGTDGQTGNADDRKKRQEEMRALYQAFEKDLKPIFDQLQHVKGINTPDYGSLTDWAISQRAAEAAKSRDGQGDGPPHGTTMWERNFEIRIGNTVDPDHIVSGKHESQSKALPPWMVRRGIQEGQDLTTSHSTHPGESHDAPSLADVTREHASSQGENEASFKKYLADIKKKHTHAADTRKDSKKRTWDEALHDSKEHEKKMEDMNESHSNDGKGPRIDDNIEWEDDGIEWENAEETHD